MKRISLLLAVALLAVCAAAQDIASFEKRITLKTLPNGLTIIICERPEAPVFAFFTMVDSGSYQDPMGKTGLAHMFEHMAFKGTRTIGTTNYAAEKAALEKVEKTYAAYTAARNRRLGRDEAKLEALRKEWQAAIAEADKYVIKNQYGELIERNGGVGMNAFTSYDETGYHFSMPVNRLELWAYLESERFLEPVMREFYKERDVVMEERRMRIESRPTGRLFAEQFIDTAFSASNYHRPAVGYMADLQEFSATDAEKFFKTHYIPRNMVVAVAGDVKASEFMPVMEKYFGRLPNAPEPESYETPEPPQRAQREVTLYEQSQPWYSEGYHRPDYLDPDDAVYDAITDLLSTGRTSRLYRSLVRDKQIAAAAQGFSGFPGVKYPHLFVFYAVPLPGHTTDEMAKAIHAEIDRLKTQDVTDEELKMVKTRAKANLIRSLGSNSGLVQNLATYQTRYGDWRELFRSVDRIDKVTKEDIRRVANKIFVDTNRTVGIIQTRAPQQQPKPQQTAAPQGGQQ
jgi:predicted Zn-dependent peptidase